MFDDMTDSSWKWLLWSGWQTGHAGVISALKPPRCLRPGKIRLRCITGTRMYSLTKHSSVFRGRIQFKSTNRPSLQRPVMHAWGQGKPEGSDLGISRGLHLPTDHVHRFSLMRLHILLKGAYSSSSPRAHTCTVWIKESFLSPLKDEHMLCLYETVIFHWRL